LVDTITRKKVLQEWGLPSGYSFSKDNFAGISADGKKLYLNVEDNFLIGDKAVGVKVLALEIYPDGTIKIVSKAEIKRKFSWEYLEAQTELNDTLARVTINGKVYILALPVTDY
jgi:hypothetical protein